MLIKGRLNWCYNLAFFFFNGPSFCSSSSIIVDLGSDDIKAWAQKE